MIHYITQLCHYIKQLISQGIIITYLVDICKCTFISACCYRQIHPSPVETNMSSSHVPANVSGMYINFIQYSCKQVVFKAVLLLVCLHFLNNYGRRKIFRYCRLVLSLKCDWAWENRSYCHRQKFSGAVKQFLHKTRYWYLIVDIPFLQCLTKLQLPSSLLAADMTRSLHGCRFIVNLMNGDLQIT